VWEILDCADPIKHDLLVGQWYRDLEANAIGGTVSLIASEVQGARWLHRTTAHLCFRSSKALKFAELDQPARIA
jgi:hypothetical protein